MTYIPKVYCPNTDSLFNNLTLGSFAKISNMNDNITPYVRYIGADDKDLDLFESQYVVPQGISYNSYVITDEKIAVMDTIDQRKTEEWTVRLEEALEGRTPDYLIVQHMEPDHAGSLARLIELFPEITVVGNAKTFVMINQFFENINIKNFLTVKEGDTLNLGSHTLTFVMAPMVHWPEVMVTYESSEKVLFSADGFGKFGALSLTENADWACEARRYYFNIVGKYGAPVQTLLKKASALDIKTICPLHGPVLSDNLGYYLDLYNTWSSYQPESKGVFIAYASIHGNTAYAAEQFAEMLRNKGVDNVVITDLSRCDIAEAVEDAFRYDRMVLAAASYDAGVSPIMQDFLHHLQAKAFQNRTVGLIENGSWAPTAAKTMRNILETMKNITIVEPVVTIKSVLKETDIPALDQLADALK